MECDHPIHDVLLEDLVTVLADLEETFLGLVCLTFVGVVAFVVDHVFHFVVLVHVVPIQDLSCIV